MITSTTEIIIQGITGKHGSYHARQMKQYGTKIVAGVRPGKHGESIEGIPVFDTVKDAIRNTKASWSVLFVPPIQVKLAAFEALEEGLNLVIITEHVPLLDTLAISNKAQSLQKTVIGPNCPGLVRVGETTLGIIPNHILLPGDVGIVSRSGTLTYEIVDLLSKAGIGQSLILGIGGDVLQGTNLIEALHILQEDKQTKHIILIGEIGGDIEERAAIYIKEHITKPVIAYIVGTSAPKEKYMGHAGAIIAGSKGTAQAKIKAFKDVQVPVASKPQDIITLLRHK